MYDAFCKFGEITQNYICYEQVDYDTYSCDKLAT